MSSNPISEAELSLTVAPSSSDLQREEACKNKSVSLGRRLRCLFWHIIGRQFTLLCVIAVKVVCLIGRRRRELLAGQGCEIMLTGRFDSENWILAHLGPLSASKECSRIWMVSTNPVPILPNVIGIYPPKWLIKILGVTPARLLTFLWSAMRKRPHIVGGFHIIVNGIAATIIGNLAGSRSMYFCVGGSAEISDGGIHNADSYFTKMGTADHIVERRLLKIISKFDMIITMGKGAIKYFREKGIETDSYVVAGGIDPNLFKSDGNMKLYDLILTGRLVEVKRIDVFLHIVKLIADRIPDIKAVIVGDGNLFSELKKKSCDLCIERNVNFAGHQNNVENWLQNSKIFVLTSDSEGLSLSMIEAMMCGLPAVVSNVGDLGDLVKDGINGFLVPRRSPEKFAARIIELLTDDNTLKAFSIEARKSALKCSTQSATEKWDNIIESFRKG